MWEEYEELLDRAEQLNRDIEEALSRGEIGDLEELLAERLEVGEGLNEATQELMLARMDEDQPDPDEDSLAAFFRRSGQTASGFLALVSTLEGLAEGADPEGLPETPAEAEGEELAVPVDSEESPAEPEGADELRQELADHLATGPLAGRDVVVLEIPRGQGVAYAVRTAPGTAYEDRRWLREHPGPGPSMPVVTCGFGMPDGTWAETILESRLLDRFEYEDEGLDEEEGAEAVLKQAAEIEVDSAFAEMVRQRFERSYLSWEERVQIELDLAEERYGVTPEQERLLALAGEDNPEMALERAVWEWEGAEGRSRPPVSHDHLDWYEPTREPMAILLLPAERPADLLAHVHFYGANSFCTSAFLVALLRQWEERFGAELVAHMGTMLHFVVQRPPSGLEQAWPLAQQQVSVAECTTALKCMPMRAHAASLVDLGTWFLHERP